MHVNTVSMTTHDVLLEPANPSRYSHPRKLNKQVSLDAEIAAQQEIVAIAADQRHRRTGFR